MEILKYSFIALISLAVLLILVFAIRSRKLFKTLLLNAVLGLGALAVIDLTAKWTGVYIPVNYWTSGAGGVLGLPAVFGLLISNFIFL